MFRRPIADISLLNDFNPALVSCFEPEADPRLSSSEQDMEKLAYLTNRAHQHEDMLTGYLHAQSILTLIRERGKVHITKQQLLTWICELHARLAAQLADTHATKAGEYTRSAIARWHYSSMTQTILAAYCENDLTENETIILLTQQGVDEKLAKAILKIAKMTLDQVKHALANNRLTSSANPSTPGFLSGTTFAIFRNNLANNLFSADEKNIIDRFVKFGMNPDDIPSAMNKFAEKFLSKWQQCDGKNIDELCDFIYFAFYQLTEIHPFFNGNGRTATCLVNIILRSYGLPSILLRVPGERSDKNSIYSLAITGLETNPPNPAPFIALIKHRLAQAQEKGPYENPMLDELTGLRCRLAHFRKSILALSSEDEELKRHLEVNDKIMPEVKQIIGENLSIYNDQNAIAILRISVPYYEATLRELTERAKAKPQTSAITRFNPNAKTYTTEDKSALAAMLATLSTHQQWKIYVKNGALVALHTVLNDEQGSALITTLQKTGACDAALQRVATDKSLVVYVHHINIEKLNSLCASKQVPLSSNTKHAM